MALKWRDCFSCNVKEIDNQHKKLLELGSELHTIATSCIKCDHHDEIKKIINALKEYTVFHFGYEEKLMLESNFSGYLEHKYEHEEFIKKVLRFEQEDLDINQIESVMSLITFVSNWIASHILKTDMQYKDFFNSKGIF